MLLSPFGKWCHTPQWWYSSAARVDRPLTSDTSAFTASGVLPVRLPSCSILSLDCAKCRGVFPYSLDKLRSVPAGKGSTQSVRQTNSTVGWKWVQPNASRPYDPERTCLADSLAHYTQSNILDSLHPRMLQLGKWTYVHMYVQCSYRHFLFISVLPYSILLHYYFL